MLFDTHAHYDDEAFDADRDALLTALPDCGVGLVIDPGCDLTSSRRAVELAAAYPHVYAAVGIHPENCGGCTDDDLAALRPLAQQPKVVRHWLYATLYATLVSSGMIDLLAGVYTFRPMEPMLAAVYGGVIVGLGCGLMLRYSATTGGTELAARLLKLKLPGLSIGTLCLAIDTIVVVSYAAVFRDLTQALYAMVALFIISKVMDRVVYGGNGAKMAYIVSERYEEITAKLLELDRGVTLLEGRGGYSGKAKNVILCAFSRAQIVAIKSIVKQADPDAFIIVCDAYEILGEGFGVNTPNGL